MKSYLGISIALLFAAALQPARAQEKLKEGKLTFEISYPESDDMNDQMLAMLPKDMVRYFKGAKSYTEVKWSMGSTATISDSTTHESVICMDMMDKKTAMKYTPEDAAKDQAERGEYDVKITDETKKIAGYKCKKAIVTFKNGDKNTTEVWFTNELDAANSTRDSYKGIPGFMMEYATEQKGMHGSMKMKLTCTKVEKIPVSDDMFKIPDGYTVMTRDEMMQQFQKRKAATPRDNLDKKAEKDSIK